MAVGQRVDPYKNHRFLVEVDGLTQAGFREVIIPESRQDAVEYRNGDEPPTVRKLPGLVRYGNVILKWGITNSKELYEWRRQIEEGKVGEARKSMAIVLLNDVGETSGRWEFSQAWPARYDAPELNATANEIAIEVLEIAHEGMRRTV